MCTWAVRGLFKVTGPTCPERNSLFIHVLDMSELGPAFSYHSFKNLPLDDVIKADFLTEESQNMTCYINVTVYIKLYYI